MAAVSNKSRKARIEPVALKSEYGMDKSISALDGAMAVSL